MIIHLSSSDSLHDTTAAEFQAWAYTIQVFAHSMQQLHFPLPHKEQFATMQDGHQSLESTEKNEKVAPAADAEQR